MAILSVSGITKAYQGRTILKDLAMSVDDDEVVGLIGRNGTGKSTLLKIIMGLETADEGEIAKKTGLIIGYASQHIEYDPHTTLREFISLGLKELKAVEAELVTLESKLATEEGGNDPATLKRYEKALSYFEALGGYGYETKVDEVAELFQFTEMLDQTVTSLSGGQKNLLKIAQVWIQNPDLLILDEPGNHLDFKGLAWLEDFISNCGKAVLIVSHDRYLLDRVVTRTVEIDKKKTTSYPGNYSFYKMEKTKALLAQQAAFGAQQKELARLDKMVKQFEAWASRSSNNRHAKQARSKQKMMDSIERVDKPSLNKRIRPNFSADNRAGQVVIEAKGFSKAFGEKILFDDAKFVIYWGDNVGLLGDNGSGKTTLFKEILEEYDKQHRENGLKVGMSVKPGYYSQEHETLDFEKTIREELSQSLKITEESAFHLALKFLFTWDDMVKKVKYLSGGEKSRMQLAKLTYLGCNLLLMDEPTNHLDIESREELEDSLLEFNGTLVVISHDRYFLDKVTTKLMTIENKGMDTFEGGFSDYWLKVGQKKLFAQKAAATSVNEESRSPKKKSTEFQELSDSELEIRINELEGKKQDLERQLEAAFNKGDTKKTSVITKEIRIITERIENAYVKLAGS